MLLLFTVRRLLPPRWSYGSTRPTPAHLPPVPARSHRVLHPSHGVIGPSFRVNRPSNRVVGPFHRVAAIEAQYLFLAKMFSE